MPTFLELTALNRSQRLRIGGLVIPPDVPSRVNLGLVDPPATAVNALVKTEAKATGASGGLKKNQFYVYVITSVDAKGNESQPSPAIFIKAGAGVEGAGSANFNKLEWTPVPYAAKYRLYRTPAAGAASQAAAEEEVATLIAEVTGKSPTNPVVQTSTELFGIEFTDEGSANKTAEPPITNKTVYNVAGSYSTRRDLKFHSAEGAFIVYNGPTTSNLDWSPILEGHTGVAAKGELSGSWGMGLETEKVKLALSKQQVQRSTGRVVSIEAKAIEPSGIKAASGKFRFSYVVYNTATHLLQVLKGAEATTEAKALAEAKTLLAAYHQVLYLLRNKESTAVENVTELLLGGPNAPAIASQP